MLTVFAAIHLSFFSKAAANSSAFLALRKLNNIDDRPATYSIPLEYLYPAKDAKLDVVNSFIYIHFSKGNSHTTSAFHPVRPGVQKCVTLFIILGFSSYIYKPESNANPD